MLFELTATMPAPRPSSRIWRAEYTVMIRTELKSKVLANKNVKLNLAMFLTQAKEVRRQMMMKP